MVPLFVVLTDWSIDFADVDSVGVTTQPGGCCAAVWLRNLQSNVCYGAWPKRQAIIVSALWYVLCVTSHTLSVFPVKFWIVVSCDVNVCIFNILHKVTYRERCMWTDCCRKAVRTYTENCIQLAAQSRAEGWPEHKAWWQGQFVSHVMHTWLSKHI